MSNDSGSHPVLIKNYSFEQMLDKTCSRLWDTKVRYSLKRIEELDRCLAGIETELDEFLKAAGR
ncbi:MAG: hypothetical protein LBG76_04370 [Treponema sp.]|jgi:hypothetical protein|nr:hypothetical protein [Treponema sp.]